MAKKRPAQEATPEPEQLVFPFQLRVGDIVDDEGTPAEVVERPTSSVGGKMTHAWLRREGATVKNEMIWEAWRKVRVVRRAAA